MQICTTFTALALTAAQCALAQDVYMTVSNQLPSDGEVVTLDVVLDASRYSGDFYAWHSFSFNINVFSSIGDAQTPQFINTEEDLFQLARTESPLGTFEPILFAPATPWATGRRPGAFFPGGGSEVGGVQTVSGEADVVTGTSISSTSGAISGAQAPNIAGADPTNSFIHIGRVYEVFRFELLYDVDAAFRGFTLSDVEISVYDGSDDGAGTTTIEPANVTGFFFIPAPGASAALLVGAGLGVGRRRR